MCSSEKSINNWLVMKCLKSRGWPDITGVGEKTYQVCFPWLGLVSVVVVPHGGLDPVHGQPDPPVSLTTYHRQRAASPVYNGPGLSFPLAESHHSCTSPLPPH